jgi:hypothetical protein
VCGSDVGNPGWFTGMGYVMTVGEKIYAYLRRAKTLDRASRISDFQMQVEKDSVTLVNLKTRAAQTFSVEEKDRDWF